MRGRVPVFAAALCLSSVAIAQQADDYALRFNGTTDFIAIAQTSGAVNSFTIDLWVNPTAEHEIDAESHEGYGGLAGQRYAVYPAHGTHCWGKGHAGVGISVGTNGVSVYEHAGDYIPAVLVHEQSISGWTRVTLVYRDRTPHLYINGRLARTGSRGPYAFVHPSSGDAHPGRMVGGIGGGTYGYYAGEIDNVRIWSTALGDAEVASPQSLPLQRGLILSLDMNRSGAGRGLAVGNAAATSVGAADASQSVMATVALTHGTERSPVFTLRPRQDVRIGSYRSIEYQATPLEGATAPAPGSIRQRPTIQ